MSGIIEKTNEWVTKWGGLVTITQFILPLAVTIMFIFAKDFFVQKTTYEQNLRDQGVIFESMNLKLTSILNNQSVFTEQMKTVNQILSTQNQQILRLDDRILYLERTKTAPKSAE